MTKTTRLIASLVALIVALPLMLMSHAQALPTHNARSLGPLTTAQAQAPITITDPTGRVTFMLTVASEQPCGINAANGFSGPQIDTGNLDGTICASGGITYNISYNVKPSDVETKMTLSVPIMAWDATGPAWQWSTLGIDRLLTGGSGFAHTLVNGQMVFPASPATTTIDAGTFNWNISGGDHVSERMVGTWFSPYFKLVSNNVTYESSYLPYPTYNTGATLVTPSLRTSIAPTFVVDPDGSQWWETQYRLSYFHTQLVGGNSPLTYFNTHTEVDLSMLPAGTQLSTVPVPNFAGAPSWTIQGTSAVLDGAIASRLRRDNINTTSLSHWYPLFVNARIPATSLPSGVSSTFHPEVSVFTASPALYRPTQVYPYGNTDAMVQHPLIGIGQGPNFNTRQTFPAGEFQPQGIDVVNDTVARTIIPASQTGVFTKALYSNVNDAPGTIVHDDTNFSMFHPTAKWWAELSVDSFFGNLTDATYIDQFDPKYQTIDPSRPVMVQRFEGGVMVSATDAVVRYGTVTLPAPESGAAQTALQNAYTGDTIAWSTTPSATTNVVAVTFPGTQSGGAANGTRPQRVLLPMMGTDVANFAGTNYPLNTLVYDRMVVRADNTWRGTVTRYATVKSATYDYFWGRAPLLVPVNAGTSSTLSSDGFTLSVNVDSPPSGEKFNPQPSDIIIRYPSMFSNVQFPADFYNNPSFDIVSSQMPDWGPDGLPGTPDDVSGWVWHLRLKDRALNMPSINNWLVNVGMPSVTTPGYIKNGVSVNATWQVIPGVQTIPESNAANNSMTVRYDVSSNALVSQSKWAFKPLEQVGNDIGWGVAWGSNSVNDSGEVTLYDILPYHNDPRGTKLAAPLSNVTIAIKNGDTDVSVWVTDAAPATLNATTIRTVPMVPLSQAGTLAGPITGFKVVETSLQANAVHGIEITAKTTGTADGNVVFNALTDGTVAGMALPLPATPNVVTNLYDTAITGTLWFDTDKNGAIVAGEPQRFAGITVTLRDSNGVVVATTTTDASGNYRFASMPVGTYTVTANVPTNHENTTPVTLTVPLTPTAPKASNQNFGFWRALVNPVLSKTWDATTGKFTLTVSNPSATGAVPSMVLSDRMFNTIGQPMSMVTILSPSAGTVSGNQWTIPMLEPGQSITATVNFDAGQLTEYTHVTNRFGAGVCTDNTYVASEVNSMCAEARVDGHSPAPGAPTPSTRTSTGQ